MHKGFLKTAAIFGALSVILGAFAAHSLKKELSSDELSMFETGVRYQFYHVFALLAVGILYKEFPAKLLRWAGSLFIAGIILFSGSLYFLAIFLDRVEPNMFSIHWMFFITPLGGLCFISGWLILLLSLLKKN